VKDVRGRGLMIGLELAREVHSSAPLIRVLSEQNLLGFFVSGWLLHEHGIRVAPTLSGEGPGLLSALPAPVALGRLSARSVGEDILLTAYVHEP